MILLDNHLLVSPIKFNCYCFEILGVYLGKDFVSITKAPAESWPHLKMEVMCTMLDFYATNEPIITDAPVVSDTAILGMSFCTTAFCTTFIPCHRMRFYVMYVLLFPILLHDAYWISICSVAPIVLLYYIFTYQLLFTYFFFSFCITTVLTTFYFYHRHWWWSSSNY